MELNRNVLQKCSLWSLLPWEVVVTLMAKLVPVVFPPNHLVVLEGEKSPGLHFIENGVVTVLKRTTPISPFSPPRVSLDSQGDRNEHLGEEICTMGRPSAASTSLTPPP